ncbi:efflux RND transporter periplasmic adaptor subunit [Pseudomonas aeruginosa]|nr:efflux RND transporter periplasmic adaptor subunit [Pseudomonas aeruginosa]
MTLKSVISLLATLLILLVAVFIGRTLWVNYMDTPWTRDGRVRADVINVAADVSGIVVDVPVRDNQLVKKGDLLMQIDPDHYRIAVKQAESLVASRKATLEMRQLNARRRAEMDEMVVSRESRDDAHNTAAAAMADYEQAKAQLDAARLNLERTRVVAQVDGYVTNLNVHRGDYARVGEAKMAVIDKNSYWVYGYFEETKLPYIREGDPVDMQLMSGEHLKGHVESIARGIYDRDNPESRELTADVNPTFNWVRLALASLFVQWIVLLSAALFCRLRPLLARLPVALAGSACCLLVVALTLGCTAVAEHYQLGGELTRAGEVNLYLRHALIALIMSALVLRYFYLQSQWRRQQQAELQARLESLQARIRPHFLFNSLNSIASLIELDPLKAEHAVLDLSDLFRASLAKPGTLVSWEEELALARRYLSIEQYRLGDRLQLDWQVHGVPANLPIPQLTLQPLLENALIYGIQPRVEGGLVQVEAVYREGVFQLCVSNPYDEALESPPSKGTRQALHNIDARLGALFGPKASLSVERRDGRHYTCLRYPCARLMQEA